MIDTSHKGLFFTATLIMCAACLYASELVRADADDAVQVAIAAPRGLTFEPREKSDSIELLPSATGAFENAGAENVAAEAADLALAPVGAVPASLGSATSR